MNRITKSDLDVAVSAYVSAAETLGIRPPHGHHIELRLGSKTFGNAYRLVWVSDSSGGYSAASGITDSGFLGWTAREAYTKLWSVTDAFYAVAYHQAEKD